jgi:hypothetical protein
VLDRLANSISGPTTIDTLVKQARKPHRSPKEKLDVAKLF